jgi:hypothetical protein
VPLSAGRPTRGWTALRDTARGRRTVTADPRAGRRVSVSNRAGADPKTRQPSPTWNQAYRRSSHSEGTEVRSGLCGRLKSRTHARVESGATPLRGAEALEAMPPSTAVPKRCRGTRLLGVRAAEATLSTSEISSDRSRARPAEAGGGHVSSWPATEVAGWLDGAIRLSPKRRASSCRLPPAEAG